MIKLHRSPTGTEVILNPDQFRDLEPSPTATTVRLADGTSFVVKESSEEIMRLVAQSRALVRALAAILVEDEGFNAEWYLGDLIAARAKAPVDDVDEGGEL